MRRAGAAYGLWLLGVLSAAAFLYIYWRTAQFERDLGNAEEDVVPLRPSPPRASGRAPTADDAAPGPTVEAAEEE